MNNADKIKKTQKIQMTPKTQPGSIVTGTNYRISILTERLLRLEYSENGLFEDHATQTVINRDFVPPKFRVMNYANQLVIDTEYLLLTYDKHQFTSNGLTIRMKKSKESNCSIWHYGDPIDTLKGTARTLDAVDGEITLEDGVISRNGYAVIDDSSSMILDDEGWIQAPMKGHSDVYFFGYGHSYLGCLNDFYQLCGKTPMLPRYALGNWWSRYHCYTQDEYLKLMDRFEEEKIPFSVAVIDMDWHYVKLEEKYGNGWTGYTWNEELFPDHKEMLHNLHERGMHVTLNVHPADGVRGHEANYSKMAKELGIDYENEVPISFDITDQKFLKAYFTHLHHPLEEEGVDFWWVDWQQGKSTRIPGMDPLWMLNHFHYLDNGRSGNRPLIFSRYAGIGSHRYPVGFSGDTIITWESLAFQPYFTATASNAGYGWWSHDIGGHMNGYRDDELTTRWVQFGIFSPIMRLHSSNSIFTGKEPWNYNVAEGQIMKDFLRLRHKLIPYLYTMNERFHKENLPLIQPMYYQYPNQNEAYEVPNQYFFGSELIVCPITSKMDTDSKAGSVTTWLPDGLWFDLFTGLIYKGNRKVVMYRGLEYIPVLAKAGGIIPMLCDGKVTAHTDNPEDIELHIFTGADGEFVLYEDADEDMKKQEGTYVETKYSLSWNETKCFTIDPATGNLALIPAKRNYQLKIYGLPENSIRQIKLNGRDIAHTEQYDTDRNICIVSICGVEADQKLEVQFIGNTKVTDNKILWRIYEALNKSQIEYRLKDKIYHLVQDGDSVANIISGLDAMKVMQKMNELIHEIILA